MAVLINSSTLMADKRFFELGEIVQQTKNSDTELHLMELNKGMFTAVLIKLNRFEIEKIIKHYENNRQNIKQNSP